MVYSVGITTKQQHLIKGGSTMNNGKREKVLVLENWSEYVGIHPTTHSKTDKLAGITSINTSCMLCGNCVYLHNKGIEQKAIRDGIKSEIKKQDARIKRQLAKPEDKRNFQILEDAQEKRRELVHKLNKTDVLICGFCFANNLLNYKKNIQIPLEQNTVILTSRVLDDSEIPFINRLFSRFESLGDLHNVTHAINYIKIASKNPHCTFAWWSKRPNIVKQAMEQLGITELPKNIVFIFSSYYLNKINKEITKTYDFINVVFTVFDKYYLEEHPDIEIHCGSRQCLGCLKCYTRREKGDVIYINELVK